MDNKFTTDCCNFGFYQELCLFIRTRDIANLLSERRFGNDLSAVFAIQFKMALQLAVTLYKLPRERNLLAMWLFPTGLLKGAGYA